MVPPDQPSDESSAASGALAVGLRFDKRPGGKLGKEQRRFNKLVAELSALRAQLNEWHEFLPTFEQHLATDIAPLVARYREARVQLTVSLHEAARKADLGKRERAKLVEILLWHLSELLAEAPDAALVALYDQYSDLSFAETRAADAAFALGMAQDMPGLEPNEDDPRLTVEALAKRRAEQAERDRETDASRRAGGRDNGDSSRRRSGDALSEKLARGAGDAVRRIYRRLASELHPDREADAVARARKTVLMQEANRAYAADDLLTLLDLQLQVEQLTPDALSGMAPARLREFNHLLAAQCQAAREELRAVTAPLAADFGVPDVSPTMLMHALQGDVRELKRLREECAAEAVYMRDPRNLKRVLKDYRLGDLARHDEFTLDDAPFEPSPPRRRSR